MTGEEAAGAPRPFPVEFRAGVDCRRLLFVAIFDSEVRFIIGVRPVEHEPPPRVDDTRPGSEKRTLLFEALLGVFGHAEDRLAVSLILTVEIAPAVLRRVLRSAIGRSSTFAAMVIEGGGMMEDSKAPTNSRGTLEVSSNFEKWKDRIKV